ncbi:CHAD domain-containing protein [Tuwongella immobilis]|uniref:CHAD domain-containing protein n=1 Tax=Tuwongella immobilis TaxID=692036 RepID=A0A6C2YND4_9BACT|nr:CHAD domain-containing protein [Tuwongella immobilis]VIP03128.1 Uncharacterized protein OS=Blastopirellula marina DSM 3645 GN=DSM3645_25567 PE=4 SV=1: CHAD [Tuwongella immobilis]VTS03472.1 Uncharacterized protein OS=Blastopirellula marina DSM 3645 GN=DSM3645_25567 PE=4 SV=1: CHAD [Tuwongella immobilis]
MSASGKFLSELQPNTTIRDAIRAALGIRLQSVAEFLPKVQIVGSDQAEAIHQLRVSTRRANAVIRIFGDVLPFKWAKQLRRCLRSIRQAAGDARDADVFIEFLAQHPTPKRVNATIDAFLRGYLLALRSEAQQRLNDAVRLHRPDLEQFQVDLNGGLFEKIRPERAERNLTDLAAISIPECIRAVEEAAVRMPTIVEELHQIRILGKRLRYSMEVFSNCYAPPFRDRYYPAIERLQKLLGEINDLSGANQRLLKVAESIRQFQADHSEKRIDAFQEWANGFMRPIPELREAFQSWWIDWRGLRQTYPLEPLRITADEVNILDSADRSS